MAFITNVATLQDGFRDILTIAKQQKAYMQTWSSALASNVTADVVLGWASNLNTVLARMDAGAALPGMQGYAQAQFGDNAYDVSAQYAAMRSALSAVLTWLQANMPSNSLTVTNAVVVGATFTPAQTAPLKSLIDNAVATIA